MTGKFYAMVTLLGVAAPALSAPPEGWPADPVQAFQGEWASQSSKDNMKFQIKGNDIILVTDPPKGRESRYHNLRRGDVMQSIKSFEDDCYVSAGAQKCSYRMLSQENARGINGDFHPGRGTSSTSVYSKKVNGKIHFFLGGLMRPETKAAGIQVVSY